MALQNARALLFRGEDLGYGEAAPKEVVLTSTAAASQRATNTSVSFITSSTLLGALLTGSGGATQGLAGLNRVVVNRSPRYWMTITGPLQNANASAQTLTVSIPIPPLGMVFLPCTFSTTGTATVVADSAWPVAVGPVSAAVVPLAGQSMLTLDVLVEQ